MKSLLILYDISYIEYFEYKGDKFLRKIDYRNSNIKDLENIDIIFTTNKSKLEKDLVEILNPKLFNFENNLENLISEFKQKTKEYNLIIISKFNYNINYKKIISEFNNEIMTFENNTIFILPNEKLGELKLNGNNILFNKKLNIKNLFFNEIINNNINLSDLFGLIIISKKPKLIYDLIKLNKTPHYKFLLGDTKEYDDYLKLENKEKHSKVIYKNLFENFDSKKMDIIYGKIKDNRLIIFDGLHRCSILLIKNVKTVKIKKINKFSLIDKSKYYKLNKVII
tara:strand:+ start:736 stop:1581 length:846 start_codon:yes stop_codon:yes gene_type:complete